MNGRGAEVLLEGAPIRVCQGCAIHGKKIRVAQVTTRRDAIQRYRSTRRRSPPPNLEPEPTVEVVANYATRIRTARNSLKLTQDQFAYRLNETPALLRRIEAGKTQPTVKLAQKIQRVYDITLLQKLSDELKVHIKKYMKKTTGSSLGDTAFIKRK